MCLNAMLYMCLNNNMCLNAMEVFKYYVLKPPSHLDTPSFDAFHQASIFKPFIQTYKIGTV